MNGLTIQCIDIYIYRLYADRQTDRHAHNNTVLPSGGKYKCIVVNCVELVPSSPIQLFSKGVTISLIHRPIGLYWPRGRRKSLTPYNLTPLIFAVPLFTVANVGVDALLKE